MKSKFTSLIGLFAVVTLTSGSHAADATWNLDFDGDWATDANWNPAAAPGATTGTTNPDTATFGTIITAATVINVDAGRNLAGINFAGNSSAYTLNGGSLTLTSGSTLQTSGAGSGHTDTVSSPVTLANADLDTKGSYSILSGSTTATRLLVVSGSVTGSATSGTTTLTLGGSNNGLNTISGAISNGTGGGNLAVEKTGAGTWMINGTNTFSGGLTIREGSFILASPGGSASAGTGDITLGATSGTSTAMLTVSNSFNVNRPLTVAAGSTGLKSLACGAVATPGYNGAITLNDALTIAVDHTAAAASNFSFAGTGSINLNAHALTLRLAPTNNANNGATITINKPVVGSGGIVISAGGGTSTNRTVALGGINTYSGGTTVGGTGTNRALVVNVSGNQSAATGGWNIDVNNEATSAATTVSFTTGSTVAVASGKTITLGGTSGHFGARTLNAAGTVTNDGTLIVRRSSTVNVTGDWTQNGAVTIAPQGGGNAALNVNTGGSLTYASGTNFLINTSGSQNIVTNVTINGGLLTTGVAIRNNTSLALTGAGSSSNVVLNDGGTLRLSADVASLATTNGGDINFRLGETGSGGIIDTNGFNTEINRPILNVTGQAGKLTKQGLGTLTLSGTPSYTGSTTVSAGTLSVNGTNFADESTVSIAAGATLNLNFTGTDIIGTLILGDTTYTSGTFNSTSLPGSAFLTGNGILQVGPSDPYIPWIGGFFPEETDPAIIGKTADPDNDGVPNAIEFLTGGNPNSLTDKGLFWIGVSGNQLVLSLAIRGESTVFAGTPSPAATVDGVTATIQGSTALSTFDSPVSGITFVLPAGWSATPPAGFSYHSFKLDASTGLPDKGFLRLNAQ